MNLQSVELWQVLESRLSNKLDGIVIKMAAKKMRNWSYSAVHEEKMLLQVKSLGAPSIAAAIDYPFLPDSLKALPLACFG